ncbi:hypothetical protein [Streptomyces sp. NPDC048436]
MDAKPIIAVPMPMCRMAMLKTMARHAYPDVDDDEVHGEHPGA